MKSTPYSVLEDCRFIQAVEMDKIEENWPATMKKNSVKEFFFI